MIARCGRGTDPPADQVCNLNIDEWTAERDARMKDWRETFGVK
jgi:hypothetical protein